MSEELKKAKPCWTYYLARSLSISNLAGVILTAVFTIAAAVSPAFVGDLTPGKTPAETAGAPSWEAPATQNAAPTKAPPTKAPAAVKKASPRKASPMQTSPTQAPSAQTGRPTIIPVQQTNQGGDQGVDLNELLRQLQAQAAEAQKGAGQGGEGQAGEGQMGAGAGEGGSGLEGLQGLQGLMSPQTADWTWLFSALVIVPFGCMVISVGLFMQVMLAVAEGLLLAYPPRPWFRVKRRAKRAAK